jgi:hypothetical protein
MATLAWAKQRRSLEILNSQTDQVISPETFVRANSPRLDIDPSGICRGEFSVTYFDMDGESEALLMCWINKHYFNVKNVKNVPPLLLVLVLWDGPGLTKLSLYYMDGAFIRSMDYSGEFTGSVEMEVNFGFLGLRYEVSSSDPKTWLKPLHGLPAGDVDAWARPGGCRCPVPRKPPTT